MVTKLLYLCFSEFIHANRSSNQLLFLWFSCLKNVFFHRHYIHISLIHHFALWHWKWNPFIYHNLWLTSNHAIVTNRTHSLNNKTQNIKHSSSNLNITYRICNILHNTTTAFESHSNLKIHQQNKKTVQSKGFLMIYHVITFCFYHFKKWKHKCIVK